MTGPIPYGLHVISGELTEKDTDRILSAIHRFLTYKEAAQLENLKQVYDLPDGGYFIVQHVGGLFRVIADKQEPEKFKFINDGLVKHYIPMFFSGVIEKAIVREGSDEGVVMKVTEQCRRRLQREIDQSIPKQLELQRFVVDQNNKFPEFMPRNPTVFKRTQYAAHNPGWYSGSMAKLIQFVGGYGIQDIEALPEKPIERCQFKLTDKLLALYLDKYKDVRLPGYSGLPPKNGQFQYHYAASKTDGVAFDDQNKPWLIRVDHKVWAMPLPIIPLTADPIFYEYAEELGDEELLEILNTFGAMPSGEGFPEDTTEFQRWNRAGVIIEICDNSEFKQLTPIFTARGWSFHSRGYAAFNTAYRYNELGIIECSTFKLNLKLTSAMNHYGTDKVKPGDDLDTESKQRLGMYLAKLFSGLSGNDSLSRTLKYKLRNIPQSILLERASDQPDIEGEINYWDNYVCEPMAAHNGNINQIYKGNLFHPAEPRSQPQIKFPDYPTGLCVSFDFSSLEKGVSASCNTVMYAYYDNDSLKVVKYFYTAKSFYKKVETDYEECMTVGSWFKNETTGTTTIAGHFYTTDIDDRDEVSPSLIETTVKGEDAGYDSKPSFSFIHHFAMQGSLWRNRYFTHLTKSKRTTGTNINLAVLIPMFNTSTVLHATKITGGQVTDSESKKLLFVRDPYSYRYWTYDFVFAWNTPLSKQTGKPYPKDGNPVWVELEDYNPGPCSDFADNGPWIPSMPHDMTWLIHPNKNEWLHSGGGGAPKVNEYSNSVTKNADPKGSLKWMVNDFNITLQTTIPDEQYFLPSPGQYGLGMSRTSSRVFLGQSEYVNISETNQGVWKYRGYTSLVGHSRAYHFIGVINE